MSRTIEFYKDIASEKKLAVERLGKLNQLGHHSGVKSQDEQVMLKFERK